MKSFSLVLIAMLLTSTKVFAGSSNAEIECQSQSGRTMVWASIPGDFSESTVTLSVDGKTVQYADEGALASLELNGQDTDGMIKSVIRSFLVDESILIYVEEENAGKFGTNLFTLNSKGKLKKINRPNGTKMTFKAVLGETVDPRKSDGSLLPEIRLSCTYTYEI